MTEEGNTPAETPTARAAVDVLMEKQAEGKQKADKYIWGLYITLCLVSLIESYSASSREIAFSGNIYAPMLKHAALLGSGVLIVLGVQRLRFQSFIIPSIIFGLATVGLLIYAMLFGETISGANRSVPLPFGFTLFPSEMAKTGIVFILAYLLARNLRKNAISTQGLIWCITVVTVFGGLLLLQGMTNTILFMGISFSMLIIGGTTGRKLMYVLLFYILIGIVFMGIKMLRDKADQAEEQMTMEQVDGANDEDNDKEGTQLRDGTWTMRIQRWMHGITPQTPLTSKNQQEMYSRMAQANGGIFGVFPGNSKECSRLPLAFSDYVYSIIVEDTGLIGGIGLIIIYFWLLMRAGSIARKCSRAYPALLVMGMAVMVVLQAFFHMAINTGVFPVSGQPLPLISKGGTSIWMISLAFGVMLSVSRSAVQTTKRADVNKEKEELPESMRAANPTRE